MMLDKDIVALILSHIRLSKEKIRLQLVSLVWRDAMKLVEAHPSESLRAKSLNMLTWMETNVPDGLGRLTELHLKLSELRSLQFQPVLPVLPNLKAFEIWQPERNSVEFPDDQLPIMPNLQRMTFTSRDPCSGRTIMRYKLIDFPLLSYFQYVLEEYIEANVSVPVIRVPDACEVEVDMVEAMLVSDSVIPSATRTNLVRFEFGLSGSTLPDLRHCQRLKYVKVWPSWGLAEEWKILGGIRGLPDSILVVEIKSEHRIILDEDREDLALVRLYFADLDWNTYILSSQINYVGAMYGDLYSDLYRRII